ncbi:MAG TPA: HEAT repeat domain-containing protein [Actinoplanes sp.]|nr:HEAT repeat domain-containing protein [Actinoplanes sp.]
MSVPHSLPSSPSGLPDGRQGSLDRLLRLAWREVASDDPAAPTPALVALHQRPTREVFERGVALTGEGDAVARVLGLRILRELGPEQDDGRRPFSAETIPLLRGLLATESDPEVLSWIVSTLGWHRAGSALPEVAVLAEHPDERVRYAVVWALPGLVTLTQVEPEAVRALTALCRDDDADIRYYALYSITREIESVDVALVHRLTSRMADDPDGQVRSMAAGHHAAVGEVRRQLTEWNFDDLPGAPAGSAYDALIGPILVGLACGWAAADLSELLEARIRERFGRVTAPDGTTAVVNRLLEWWQEQGEPGT